MMPTSLSQTICIRDRKISNSAKPFLIAEIGLNHNNNVNFAKQIIVEAINAGADAIKIQSYTTDQFININQNKISFFYDIFKKYELSLYNHQIIDAFCQDNGILFFSTPLSLDWVDKLETLNVPMYKIASGDLENYWLLNKIALCKKPIFISTGASLMANIKNTVQFLQSKEINEIVIFHCISLYPTPIEKINLKRMQQIKNNFSALVGFSDHTTGVDASAYAVLMGASVIEKHFTINKNADGPDHKLSVTPDELKQIRQKIDEAFEIRNTNQVDSWNQEFSGDYFGKRSMYKINNKWLPMRPKIDNLYSPYDFDFFQEHHT